MGRTLDVGCGIGRNLKTLSFDSVGVDHNEDCVAAATSLGLRAYTPESFETSLENEQRFDSLLVAHVLEHLDLEGADALLRHYCKAIKPAGRIVLITPQEAGFATDDTHIRFVDFTAMDQHAESAGLQHVKSFSFPFPRLVGKLFPYNEFVAIYRKC
jgi:2-polyprenyl-3-methyl-5-hydroxy-6-metoxy-1,4-benzoquinol methylase